MALDDVIATSGYDSHSGFREAFRQVLGCTPGDSRNHRCVFLTWMQSPLVAMVAVATDDGVCLLEFTDRRMLEAQFDAVRRRFGGPTVMGSNGHLERLQDKLTGYFAGSVRAFRVPLVYPGTPFQLRVWEKLLVVPYGETRSYQDLALAIGDPAAVRAVGRANGMKPHRDPDPLPPHRQQERRSRQIWRRPVAEVVFAQLGAGRGRQSRSS
jgi:AraC family transcriptional regulator of adaptative response/methylated-DNA-[protein]-cysteine methyltransferase